MKRKKHCESEMVKAVKELESGVSAEVVAWEYGVSRATLYLTVRECTPVRVGGEPLGIFGRQ